MLAQHKKRMSADTKEDELPVVWKPSWQLKCIFAVVGLLNFVAALDATSVSVSLPVQHHPCIFSIYSELEANIYLWGCFFRLSPKTSAAQQPKPSGLVHLF
jgi:hypothetical protein